MAQSVEQGGKVLNLFARVAGKSSQDFAKEFKAAPAEAIADFIKGIAHSREAALPILTTMDALIGKGYRFKDTWLRMSNEIGILDGSFERERKGMSENAELTRQT